jgi:hypothetical protein
MTAYTWTGHAGDGNWDNQLNWTPNGVPGPADSASISLSAAGAINLDNGFGAGTLTTNKFVTLNLSNQDTFTLGSGTGGTFANGGTLALNSTNQNTDLIIGSSKESLTAAGTIVLSNNGANRIYGAVATDTLVNVNNTIEGGGQLGAGTLTLNNAANGRIIANAGTALTINTGSAVVTNAGLLEATTGSGGLVIQSVVNNGTSGQVTGAGGDVYLQGGDLRGGTLSSSAGGAITVQGGNTGTLDGTTNAVTNTGTIAVNNQGTLAVLGSIVNTGLIALQSSNSATEFVVGPATGTPGTVTLSGAGTLSLSDNPNNYIFGAQAGDTLLNESTIAGAGQFGNGTLTLINQGTIDATGGNGLVVNTGSTVVNKSLMEATNPNGGLVLEATISNASGTLLANGANVYLQGADIKGGLLNSSGAAITVQGSQTGTLDGTANAITNAGTLAVNNQGTLAVLGSIVNTGLIALQSSNQNTEFVVGPATGTVGTVTLSGAGTLSLSDNPNNYIFGAQAGDTLLNEQTIAGAGQFGNGTLTLINHGTIDATGGNGLVVNTGSTVVNDALMEATNPNGGLVLQATINDSSAGTLLAAGANIYLQGADIIGGTLNSSGAGAVTIQGGQVATLDGSSSTVTNENQIAINNQGSLTLLGTLVNAGTISLQSINQPTEFVVGSPTLTLTGGGVVSLSDNQNNYIFGAASADVLDNVNNVIEGSGQIGDNTLTVINAGTIDATGSYSALYLNGDTLITNTALIEATGSNGLVAENTTIDDNSAGTLSAVNSNIYLQNTTVQGGLLSTTTTAAITIQGGQGATLDGSTAAVTNAGTFAINNQATLTALGTLVNTGSILLQSTNQDTEFVAGSPTLTLTGGGTISMSDNSANYIFGATGTDVLDNVNNLIEGSGQIGDNQLTLINAATIDATGSNSALYLNGDTLITNTKLIEATGSAGMYIQNTTVDDITGGTLSAVNSDIYLQNSTVQGGILSNGAGAAIAIQGSQVATLDGTSSSVTNTGLVSLQNQATLTLLGTITNDGTIALGSTNQYTELVAGSPTVTLTGSGTVTLSNNPANYIFGTTAADVLDNVNNTIVGAGSLGDTQLTFINAAAGIVDADQSNTLTLDTQGETVTNAGLLEATAGGILLLQNTSVANTGTVYANGGNVFLQGGTIAGGELLAAAGGEFVIAGSQTGTLDGSSAAVVVSGAVTLNNQATLTLLGAIENFAGIAVQSTNQPTVLLIGPATGTAGTVTLVDGGTITLSDNSANYIYGSEGGDTLIVSKDTIQGAGQLGDGQLTLVNDSTIDATGGNALYINTGAVTAINDGLMEATGSGGLVIDTAVDSSGGGTILANGSNVYLQGGTLLGGTLKSTGASINVQSNYTGGLNGTAHTVTNLGSVSISNQGTLDILGTITNDATISLLSSNQNTDLVADSASVTLTGKGTITLSDNPANRIYGAAGTDVLDNLNNLIEGAGQLGAGQLTLQNHGTIAATGGNALVLNTGSTVVNDALMEATGSGGLVIQATVNDSAGGTLLTAGGNIYLQGADIIGGRLTNSTGGAVTVQGGYSATLNGSSQSVTNAGTVAINNQGTLSLLGNITNNGTIALQSTNQNTDLIIDSSTVTVTGSGTITMSDNPANRIYGASTSYTLDLNGTTLAGAGQLGAGQLTLFDAGTIEAVGGNALVISLGSTATVNGHGQLLGIGSGGLAIENGTYTVVGLVEAENGSSVTFENGAVLTNVHTTVSKGVTSDEIEGGTYAAVASGNGATLTINAAALTTDNANLILSGAGSTIDFNGTAIENSLTGLTSGGTLQILGDRSYTTTLGLTNNGTIDLGGGTLKAKLLKEGSASVLRGFGTVATVLSGTGAIVATGGTLDLDVSGNSIGGTVSGTGTLSLDGGNTAFAAGSALDVSNVAMINGAQLLLNTSLSYAGNFDLVGPNTISGAGTLTNTGLFEQTGTGNAAPIDSAFVNAGNILVSSGGMFFVGPLTNTGTITTNALFKDDGALTGGTLNIGAKGAAATIAIAQGAGNSTVSTLTMAGGSLNTEGTTLTVTGDYNNTAAGTGNSYKPFTGVSGTIDGQETQMTAVGVDGTTINTVHGTLTIDFTQGTAGVANFVVENTGPTGAAVLRGALETTVNGGTINGHNLTGSGVTAQNFGPIAGGSSSTTYTIDYNGGSLSNEAIHLASDFANVAGLTIDIVANPPASEPPAYGTLPAVAAPGYDLISTHHS